MHVGVGAGGVKPTVRPASWMWSAPKAFVSVTVTVVSVFPAVVTGMLSMSMTAVPPPMVGCAVPLQTWAVLPVVDKLLTVAPALKYKTMVTRK